jgi:hypothetical protein
MGMGWGGSWKSRTTKIMEYEATLSLGEAASRIREGNGMEWNGMECFCE